MNLTMQFDNIKQELEKGSLVIYPTDTLYAFGALISNDHTIHQIYSLKHRPLSLPLPVAVSSVHMMHECVHITKLAQRLISQFLPGPLTLILDNKSVSSIVTAQKDTVAIRIPNDSQALELIEKTGPLTVTSANVHSQLPAVTIEKIKQIFIESPNIIYIDGGKRNGIPSTIVDARFDDPVILREGSISLKEITDAV